MVKALPVPPMEKLVLIILADHADDCGYCFIGYNRLMDETSIGSRTSISKYLDILEGSGLISKQHHASVGTGKKVNTYNLLFNDTWFLLIIDDRSKSPRYVLIDSTRRELIDKINNLKDDKKRTISPRLGPPKVHTVDTISPRRGHEPSVLTTSIEPPEDIYKPKKNKKPTNQNAENKRSIPNDFCISAGVVKWYEENGYSEKIENHFDNFVLVAEAKGYKYANWDSALKNAIRNDWAGLRKNKFSSGNIPAKGKNHDNFSERNYGECDINLPGFEWGS